MVFSIAVVALVAAINGVGNASTESRVYREVSPGWSRCMTETTPDAAGSVSPRAGDRTGKKRSGRTAWNTASRRPRWRSRTRMARCCRTCSP